MNLTTDDFETIKALAHRGELQTLRIDWMRTILNCKFFFKAKFIFKP